MTNWRGNWSFSGGWVQGGCCRSNRIFLPRIVSKQQQQHQQNGGYEVQHTIGRNTSSVGRTKHYQVEEKECSSLVSRTPGVGADATCTSKSGGRVSEIMELCYVTERIIALWYREDAQGVLEHATTLLRGKHADNYMIFNLSSRGRKEANTREVGWPQGLAPSLEGLCALCKELDSWLNAAPNRVVVLHARGGKERLGVAVSAYMNYSSICGGRDQALDRFAMRRFLDDKIGHIKVPSHRRYVEYLSGLLAGSLRINPSPLYLTHVTVLGVPLFEPTGCRAFLKVYEGLTPVYTSDLYSVTNAREFTINLGGLRLRGDILVKCYHRVYSKQTRQVMFSLQFHTCVITENVISFPRSELDVACEDSRCPRDSVVTLYFATDARRQDGPVPAPTPAVPHASAHHDPILHWDSYTNLENSDDEGRETPLSPPPPSSCSIHTSPRGLGYTCGPIDGSLYAVVNQGSGGTARGSPLTVSMDSGISSAPPQRASPPEVESQAHGDLDKLLHDMMLTVESMPDPPSSENYNRTNRRKDKMYMDEPRNYSSFKEPYRYEKGESSPGWSSLSNSNYGTLKNDTRTDAGLDRTDFVDYRISPERKKVHEETIKQSQAFSPSGKIDFIDEDIPYHARQTSQPFSYGATSDMIKHQKLSSPSLVRKASMRTGACADIDDILADNSLTQHTSNTSRTPDPPPEFANGSPKMNSEHADGLSWLRQQQLKLAARRDERSPGKLWREESGNRVIGELRTLQRSRLRNDGYASDSAVLDDDDDIWPTNNISHEISRGGPPHTSAPASPLLPRRSSSRKYNGSVINGTLGRPRAESVNERPFASVKRGYEFRKYTDAQCPRRSPHERSGRLTELENTMEKDKDDKWESFARLRSAPVPESRCDSFARTESLRRELSNSLPESRNEVQICKSRKNGDFDIIEMRERNGPTLLLSLIEKNIKTSEDPLVSLIRSLADVSPLTGNLSRNQSTNNNNINNNINNNNNIKHLISHNWLNSNEENANSLNRQLGTAYDNKTLLINSFPNTSRKACQSRTHQQQAQNDLPSSWIDRSTSPGVSNASRPQTPAFPVHPRTPYVNNSSPTVTFASDRSYALSNIINDTSYAINNNNEPPMVNNNINNNNNRGYVADRAIYIEERVSRETGLPPKSPTTQRRLSFPASGTLKQMHNKRWPLTNNQSSSFDYSKDRPVSPTSDSTISESHTIIRHAGTPTHSELAQSPKSNISYSSVNSGPDHSSGPIQHYVSRRSSIHSNTEPQEVADVNVKFVRDTSRIWYKPNISREQAISMLKDATPGTFVVRDSNSFPGAFGLALKVATPPPGAPSSPKDPSSELVRHFLIEPTSRGVRLKGCANEPVFSSLSALVYQHSLMAMALPCQLLLPEAEAAARALDSPTSNSTQQLLAQGAACNVLYLFTIDTESLTGPQAIKKSITTLFEEKPLPTATIVHFKVSTQGITLTDNARKLFFRRHYPTNNISYCGLDTEERSWDFVSEDTGRPLSAHRCFGFVARKPAHKSDNQCHVFAELELGQPATAIVNFVNKVMMGSAAIKANIV